MSIRQSILAIALASFAVAPAWAEDAWSDLRAEIYGDAVPMVAPDIVGLHVPYRTMNDPRTQLGAEVRAPLGEFIRKVTLIIDENPMPVSAVFEMAEPRASFAFEGSMRINGPTPVRVVVETDRGGLYMQESFVKTSGVGACSAPPGTDPAIAMQTLGRMELAADPMEGGSVLASLGGAAAKQSRVGNGQMAELQIEHPSHSGMQKDQITLLFIPIRFIETVEVEADGIPQFTMSGSISLSENPALRFSVPEGASVLNVRMTDTEDATFEKSFPLVSG